MEDRFRFQWRKVWHFGNKPSQQGTHDRCGEAAAGDFLGRMVVPWKRHIHSARRKFNQMAWLVEESVVFIEPRHVRGYNAGKITGPFRGGEVIVVTGGYDMNAFEVGLIDPLLYWKMCSGNLQPKLQLRM